MRAIVGDRIVIKGHRIGGPDRDCQVLEVRGLDGGPPYRVRWTDSDHKSLFFPGSDVSDYHFRAGDKLGDEDVIPPMGAIRRSAVGIAPETTIRDAAALMEQAAVGSLAVVESGRLVGIVTDRDLVCRGLARGLPHDARIDSVMTSPVVTIAPDADLHEAFSLFRTHGVRRLAIRRRSESFGDSMPMNT